MPACASVGVVSFFFVSGYSARDICVRLALLVMNPPLCLSFFYMPLLVLLPVAVFCVMLLRVSIAVFWWLCLHVWLSLFLVLVFVAV